MKKVLVLYYSQSGQMRDVINNFIAPLQEDESILVDYKKISPVEKYPYPWPFYPFFDAFPESIFLNGCEVKPLEDVDKEYDLIILGYTIWFLAPAIPITGFLKSDQAKKLFKDRPVVTVIACRDMWVMAQEKMKQLLLDLDAHLVDNVALTDQGGPIKAFLTTPRWLLTGKKDPVFGLPAAGVAPEEIKASDRFGKRLVTALTRDEEKTKEPMLKGLGAVKVNGKLVATEKIATRSFMIWGRLIQKGGKPGATSRKLIITIYAIFLVLMVLTIVPLNITIRKLLSPFLKASIKKSEAYYEKPSGR